VEQKKSEPEQGEETKQSRWGFRGMTVRNWLELLVVPLVLVGIGLLFEMQQASRQQAMEEQQQTLAEQRAQDEALQAYLDQMSSLLLENGLRSSQEDSEARTLARARTLAVLGRLDASRKATVMQFLAEAELVQSAEGREPIIGLGGADLSGPKKELDLLSLDLSGALLSEADLRNVDLRGANLSKVDLRFSDLRGALLSGTDLSGANLNGALLDDAYLRGTNLRNSNLSAAHLPNADLSDANLSNANLSNANLSNANLSSANLSGANLSGGISGNVYSSAAALSGANLSGADFSEANLSGVRGVTSEELKQQAYSLEGATMPGTQKAPSELPEWEPLPAGVHVSNKFKPAFRFEVGGGWIHQRPETAEVLFIGTGPRGGQLLFTSPNHVYDPNNPSNLAKVPAPDNAEEWTLWFESHAHLDTSKPVPVSVGGVPGVQIDAIATSKPENYSRDICGPVPCVPLYSGIVSRPDWKDRFIMVKVEGETVVMNISTPINKFDEFSPKAQEVLDTVEWEGT